MERIVERREAITPYPFIRKRTTAYARVSSDKTPMAESLAAQVNYYSAHICKNPLWECIWGYANEARPAIERANGSAGRLIEFL